MRPPDLRGAIFGWWALSMVKVRSRAEAQKEARLKMRSQEDVRVIWIYCFSSSAASNCCTVSVFAIPLVSRITLPLMASIALSFPLL